MQSRTELFRVLQRIIWRHIIKINDYPRQDPAYRHKHIKNHRLFLWFFAFPGIRFIDAKRIVNITNDT